MTDQSQADRELQEERDAAVGQGVGGADATGTGNILASSQRDGEDDQGEEPSSGAGEDEGGTSSEGNDGHLTDEQKSIS